jgi:hypothetical protein
MKFGQSLRASSLSLFVLLLTPAVYPQTNTGRILVSVKDQSGGAIADAAITVTEANRGVTRAAVTDASGEFVVSNLPPGKPTSCPKLSPGRNCLRVGRSTPSSRCRPACPGVPSTVTRTGMTSVSLVNTPTAGISSASLRTLPHRKTARFHTSTRALRDRAMTRPLLRLTTQLAPRTPRRRPFPVTAVTLRAVRSWLLRSLALSAPWAATCSADPDIATGIFL